MLEPTEPSGHLAPLVPTQSQLYCFALELRAQARLYNYRPQHHRPVMHWVIARCQALCSPVYLYSKRTLLHMLPSFLDLTQRTTLQKT